MKVLRDHNLSQLKRQAMASTIKSGKKSTQNLCALLARSFSNSMIIVNDLLR